MELQRGAATTSQRDDTETMNDTSLLVREASSHGVVLPPQQQENNDDDNAATCLPDGLTSCVEYKAGMDTLPSEGAVEHVGYQQADGITSDGSPSNDAVSHQENDTEESKLVIFPEYSSNKSANILARSLSFLGGRRSTWMRVNMAGESEVVASGFRTPNGIGEGPGGAWYVNDNEGDWLPSSKLVLVPLEIQFL